MPLREKITREELILHEILKHPVLCAEFINNLDKLPQEKQFEYDDYQKEMSCDFNNHVSLACARAVGKCIHSSSRILNPTTGEYKTAKEWFNVGLSNILSIDNNWKQMISNSEIVFNGYQDCISLNLSKGFNTIVTYEHPILTNNGFKKANDIKIGDYIATAKNIPYFGNNHLNKNEIIALALFMAEGTYQSASITTTDYEIINDIKDISNYFDCNIRKNKITYFLVSKKNKGHGEKSNITGYKNNYYDFLDKFNIRFKHSYEKFIPDIIFTLVENELSLFIRKLFDCDGWCMYGKNNEVGYSTTSKEFALGLHHLLLRFGIHSSLIFKKNKHRGSHSISIKGIENLINFKNKIGFSISRKSINLDGCINKIKHCHNQADILPVPNYTKYRKLSKMGKRGIVSRKIRYYPSRLSSKDILNKDGELNKFIGANIIWTKVTDMSILKNQETYAIGVPDSHTHLIDNIWSHNTTVLSGLIVWILINDIYQGDYINYHVPGKSHVEPVFTNLDRMFRSNTLLKHFLPKKGGINHSDLIIKLENGASLLCRIAGQTGTGAPVIGLHSPFIIVDEDGYYPYGTWTELQPTKNTFTPGFRLIASGVPTGLRERNVLYHVDKENSSYTKHRVSALQNPRFSDRDKQEAIEMYGGEDSEDYIHLVLGQHGKPIFALFDRESMHIDDYPIYKMIIDGPKLFGNIAEYYNKLSIFPGLPNKNSLCIMGMDLGYSEPTAIWIMYENQTGQLKFHGKIRLNKVDYYIQEKIIDWLDTKFSPMIIGVDEGSAGKAVIPRLRDAIEFSHKNFKETLTPINFSSQILLGIDADGKEIKAKTKPYAVSILQEYTVNHKIAYSSTDTDIITELERMTYSKTPSGELVYRTLTERGGRRGEDHFTQALLCACMAYYLKKENLNLSASKKKLAKARWM